MRLYEMKSISTQLLVGLDINIVMLTTSPTLALVVDADSVQVTRADPC
jgi:hypothetical protein